MKIHSKGKKFDLGVGNQFDSVEDLIEHYRKYPFSVGGGALVRLHEVFLPSFVINNNKLSRKLFLCTKWKNKAYIHCSHFNVLLTMPFKL